MYSLACSVYDSKGFYLVFIPQMNFMDISESYFCNMYNTQCSQWTDLAVSFFSAVLFMFHLDLFSNAQDYRSDPVAPPSVLSQKFLNDCIRSHREEHNWQRVGKDKKIPAINYLNEHK